MCDGHVVYQGLPKGVPDHFAKINIDFHRFCNPADVAMKILAINYPKKATDEAFIKQIKDLYDTEQKETDLELAQKFSLNDVSVKPRAKPGCCLQFKMICKRNVHSIRRNPLVFKARMG